VRIFNRLLAFVVAFAIAAAGIITIVEVVGERGLSSGPVIINWRGMLHWGQHNTWQAMSVELACGATAIIGLSVVMLQLKPRRPSRIPLQAGENTTVALSRGGMAATVRSAALDVEGISGAKVRVGHSRIAVKVRSAAVTNTEAQAYAGPVRDAVSEQLDPLGPHRRQRIKVRVQTRTKENED
jgi:hypothetical protein